ncbi:tRNA epoxyqueuosine(34) reductase QueG [Aestuariibacter sp. A3R04]|uniref:tRNA epoxyqueuosine(34) reductase QueG n=1 Tax=Aestuariibacter sp. A3R04 TaxID=2841571 RepID=UPI001C0A4416|nr:tRNA epoxyqueuosine(34) reductase QueG [Aestuariibacter sp. A3R04]MBU3023601.1 tRNA epoxyqueuosine(34) reductase QueG [Aestuariibacter sp. A3R04]
MSALQSIDLIRLTNDIKAWGRALGFQQVGISDVDLSQHETYLTQWLENDYHGDMEYMAAHGMKRARPAELVPGTLRVISVRMDYLPPDASFARHLKNNRIGYISRYALGRDYHKLVRNRLKKLGQKITDTLAHTAYRPFVDSAPVLEHAIAEKAGIGWTGKHSLTLSRDAGSWFFLGELFVNLPLPIDEPVEEGCGSCTACLTMCPTNAIVAPYTVDARKCISYLTIENSGPIPEALRPLMGNRIYGCDDCQLVCPWNRYASVTEESDFAPREVLHGQRLETLFLWDEETFLKNTEGSAIRRIGHERWLRNIAVAMGNADPDTSILAALEKRSGQVSPLVQTHIDWALARQRKNTSAKEAARQQQRLIRVVEKGLPRDA